MLFIHWLHTYSDCIDYSAAGLCLALALAVRLFVPKNPRTKRPRLDHPLAYTTLIVAILVIVSGIWQLIYW